MTHDADDLPIIRSAYLQSLIFTARTKPGWWIIPVASALLIGLLAAFLGPQQWQATQTFVLREEMIGRIVGPGRFESLDSMKTAQETIQEVAKKPSVIRRTLLAAGPETTHVGDDWPSEEAIEGFQGSVSFFAPNGAEFGKTEILGLNIKGKTRDRAKQLAAALFNEMQIEIRNIRERRAESMQQEIRLAVELANERLKEAANKLARIEAEVGADLSELRNLNDPASGTSNLRNIYVQVQADLRGANSQLAVNRKQKQHLTAAQKEPDQLVATPKELLLLQPALAILKQKLIEAQVGKSTLNGKYSESHPAVVATSNAISDIKRQIHAEVANSMPGIESQLALAEQKVNSLSQQAKNINNRLAQIAKMRVDYGQIVNEFNLRSDELTMAQKDLTQTESIRRAAAQVDMITPIDDPQVGTSPIGPSKKTILASALIAGTLIGLGLVMMMTPASPPTDGGPTDQSPARTPPPAPTPETEPKRAIPTSALPGSFSLPDINPTLPPPTPLG